MKLYTLSRDVELPCSPEELFPFFGDPRNLERMTPPWLRFRILSELPETLEVDSRITYRLRLHGIPVRWVTRIAAWEPPRRFVDEQLSGLFRRWVHEHRFEPTATGGTLARDMVTYAVPGGVLVHRLFVRRDLEAIFDFRSHVLREVGEEIRAARSGARS